MLNLSDKELDRLSREAAGQFEIDENISSWEKLEQELDKEIGTISNTPAPRSGIVVVSYVSLAILLAGVAIFLFKNGKNNNDQVLNKNMASAIVTKTPARSAPIPSSSNRSEMARESKTKSVLTSAPLPASSAQPRASVPTIEKTRLDNNKKATLLKIPATTIYPPSAVAGNTTTTDGSAGATKDLAASSPQKSGKDRYTGNKTASSINYSKKHAPLSQSPHQVNLKDGRPSQNPVRAHETDKYISDNLSGTSNDISSKPVVSPQAPAEEQLKTSKLPAVEQVTVFNQHISDSSLRAVALLANTINSGVAQAGNKNPPSLHINRSLHIGILAAPDFTNVGNAYNDKMSSNFGLTLGYHLFNNISVNTGIIFTRKNYAANGYDFHSENQWFNMIKLDYIQGSCNMLEIPLTVRYDYSTIGKTKFFINGGLSSYLMRHESYVYYYHASGYSGNTMKDYDDHDNYLFSTVSLSLGVEQQISNSLSLQVEPFVKLPLSGIGYGNLPLTSYGLGFSLRYSPALGKSRH